MAVIDEAGELNELVLGDFEVGIGAQEFIIVGTSPSDPHSEVLPGLNGDNFLPMLVPHGDINVVIANIFVLLLCWTVQSSVFGGTSEKFLNFHPIEMSGLVVLHVLEEELIEHLTASICIDVEHLADLEAAVGEVAAVWKLVPCLLIVVYFVEGALSGHIIDYVSGQNFELAALQDLEGDEVDVHGMGERDGAKHGVDEEPVLCRSDPWILACSAFAEFIVPVDEEVEFAVSEQRPHPPCCNAFGSCAGFLERVSSAGLLADVREIVEGRADGGRNGRRDCILSSPFEFKFSPYVGIFDVLPLPIGNEVDVVDIGAQVVDFTAIDHHEKLDSLSRAQGEILHSVDWLIEESGICANDAECQLVPAIGEVEALNSLFASSHKPEVAEDGIELAIKDPEAVGLVAGKDEVGRDIEGCLSWIDLHVCYVIGMGLVGLISTRNDDHDLVLF